MGPKLTLKGGKSIKGRKPRREQKKKVVGIRDIGKKLLGKVSRESRKMRRKGLTRKG